MVERQCEMWDKHRGGELVVITTNCTPSKTGNAVMGRGCALEAQLLYPELPKIIGKMFKVKGCHTFYFERYRIFSFPVKYNYWEKADYELITNSAIELVNIIQELDLQNENCYIPRPGCGYGQLSWKKVVKPLLEPILIGDKFIIVNNKKEKL